MIYMRRVVIAIRGTTHLHPYRMPSVSSNKLFALTRQVREHLLGKFPLVFRLGRDNIRAINYRLAPSDGSLEIEIARAFFVTAFHYLLT